MSEIQYAIDPKCIINRQGKDFVTYPGLYNAAYPDIEDLDTELLHAPTDENGHMAVVKCRLVMRDPNDHTRLRKFSGIGDASPANVGKMIAPHVTRMAETRAKARALRDGINVGMTALEELGDDDIAPSRQQAANKPVAPKRKTAADVAAPSPTDPVTEGELEMLAVAAKLLHDNGHNFVLENPMNLTSGHAQYWLTQVFRPRLIKLDAITKNGGKASAQDLIFTPEELAYPPQ